MPQPLTPARVQAARAVALWCVRATSVVLIAWGTVQIGTRVLWALINGRGLDSAWNVYTGLGETHGVYRGLPILAVGVALAVFGRPLVRWIVRPPAQGCPGCGYSVAGDIDTCPECGLTGLRG